MLLVPVGLPVLMACKAHKGYKGHEEQTAPLEVKESKASPARLGHREFRVLLGRKGQKVRPVRRVRLAPADLQASLTHASSPQRWASTGLELSPVQWCVAQASWHLAVVTGSLTAQRAMCPSVQVIRLCPTACGGGECPDEARARPQPRSAMCMQCV